MENLSKMHMELCEDNLYKSKNHAYCTVDAIKLILFKDCKLRHPRYKLSLTLMIDLSVYATSNKTTNVRWLMTHNKVDNIIVVEHSGKFTVDIVVIERRMRLAVSV